jgi:hypothetical protein
MAGKIFINYRRGDDPGHTGRLFDRLQDVFPVEQLFLDVDNIAPGMDFVRVLNERIADCDIVLAVIGKGWLDARDATGARRLDDPDDFVRIEIASALDQGKRVIPVLVGGAPMPSPEDLPEALRALSRRNAVRLSHERFRADTQGLVKALHESLEEIEARRRADAEAARRVEAEADRQRQQAEAARRAEEEELRKKAEREAKDRAAAERHRQEAEAKRRAEAERAFTAAKRAGTVLALDAFLAAHRGSSLADEARILKATLRAREDAFRQAMTSGTAAELQAFLATYRSGADVDQVRRRVRLLERKPGRLPSPALVVLALLIVGAIAGAAFYWHEIAALSPLRQQPLAAAIPLPAAPGDTTNTGPPAATSSAALVPPAPPTPAAPPPDAAAWILLKDTTDATALRRFTVQYPDSALRQEAEARIATLEAERAATPAPPAPDQIAWAMVKDSRDVDALRRFVEKFPNSSERAQAEQRIAALAADAQKPPAANVVADPHELARALQFELQRVGCFDGVINGEFDDATKAAWRNFTKLTSTSLPEEASVNTVKAVRDINKRVCPLTCAAGQHVDGEQCIANPAPPPKRADVAPPRPASHPATAPRGGGKCFSFQGRQFCE